MNHIYLYSLFRYTFDLEHTSDLNLLILIFDKHLLEHLFAPRYLFVGRVIHCTRKVLVFDGVPVPRHTMKGVDVFMIYEMNGYNQSAFSFLEQVK